MLNYHINIQIPFSSDLYIRRIVYLVILINDDDYIVVPPLKGFVMNRVQGDYFETLLYKVFVSINEHTNISELASVLQIDLQEVKVCCILYVPLFHLLVHPLVYCFIH